ncbi:3-phosphoshikimate 1-carboxyvinyltransferase [Streptomyces microflavus]|uniref:3-phosphoshikimate 1-carboxyvinyltransferase n=1 Tax=Streptomyces microflavus TaxID=1919 RepID=UPI0034417349
METETDRIEVHPAGGRVSGSVRIPGSKSITNRAIALAMASTGTSLITNPLFSDDTARGLDAAQALGCKVLAGDDEIEITGIGRQRPAQQATIHVGSAGTIARFLPCILAFGEPGEWHLTSSAQMAKRPIDGLGAALNQLGDPLAYDHKPGRYPITIRGGSIRSSTAHVDGSISSQYLSGLLLAAPLNTTPIRITTDGAVVQSEYVRMTIDCMRRFGAQVDATDDLSRIDVEPAPYRATTFDVEADASTATYFAALPAVAGGAIELTNLARASRQPDIQFIEILTAFGCTADWTGDLGVRIQRPHELTRLRGGHRFNLNACSDVALTVAALSAFADAPVEISGIEHIRHHECDRIDAMTAVLRAVGTRVQERPDGWLIEPDTVHRAEVQTRDDHRMAMASALIGIGGPGISLDHPTCVTKTCPTFFEILSHLGLSSDRTTT